MHDFESSKVNFYFILYEQRKPTLTILHITASSHDFGLWIA